MTEEKYFIVKEEERLQTILDKILNESILEFENEELHKRVRQIEQELQKNPDVDVEELTLKFEKFIEEELQKSIEEKIQKFNYEFQSVNADSINGLEIIPAGTKLIIPEISKQPEENESHAPNESTEGPSPSPSTPKRFLDFSRADLWVGRLMQIVKKVNVYNSIISEMSHELDDAKRADEQSKKNIEALSAFEKHQYQQEQKEIALSPFEKRQVGSLRLTLNNIENFCIFVLTRYFIGILPPNRIVPKGQNIETHLIRAVLNHLSTDLDIILAAVSQRRRRETDGKLRRTTFGDTLIQADILALEAFSPADKYLKHLLLDNATIEVVTYFSENTKVRILPYYPDIVLIGLPYSVGYFEFYDINVYPYHRGAFNREDDKVLEATWDGELPFEAMVPWEFLMLPHEIAHFVYWNGRLPHKENQDKTLEDHFREKLTSSVEEKDLGLSKRDWRYQWFEELFCDVYCCLIMGPVAVLGLQALISDADPDHLFLDDGAHPTAGLRPFIASLILDRAYPGQFENAIEHLDENWKAYLTSIGELEKLDSLITVGERHGIGGGWLNQSPRDHDDAQPTQPKKEKLSYDAIMTGLTPVIDLILEELKLEADPSSRRYKKLPWSNELKAGEDLSNYHETLQAITRWEAKDILPAAYRKRVIDYNASSQMAQIKGADNNDLPKHLIESYLSTWGDKGGEGDIVPESADKEDGKGKGSSGIELPIGNKGNPKQGNGGQDELPIIPDESGDNPENPAQKERNPKNNNKGNRQEEESSSS
ncbi:MAG: hypothetical protein AAF490_20790 [Chloroflexota bacterium]